MDWFAIISPPTSGAGPELLTPSELITDGLIGGPAFVHHDISIFGTRGMRGWMEKG